MKDIEKLTVGGTSPELPRHEYPRPQLCRPEWMNLNGEWEYETDRAGSGRERRLFEAESLPERITVPFCRESVLSGIGDTDFCGSVWYRRRVTVPAGWLTEGKRVLLHIGACDWKCQAWVNGVSVGTHIGGYISFSFDITDALGGSSDAVITVCADDDTRSHRQPAGKQSGRYGSYGCFYTRTTGIWQTVWLECVPAAHIQNVKYYTDIDNSILSADITVSGGDGLTLLATAEYDGVVVGTSSALVSGKLARITVPLSELHLWEPGEGRLYGLSLELCGEHPDRVESYFGMRSVTSKNGILYINHKPVFQRLVLDQGFYPDGIYTAPDDAGLTGDIERSIACGFNGARLHQKIFEPRFLYHCDRMGYIVWGEHANWGLDISAPEAWKGFLVEWLECLVRDFSPPAIIGWCPLNETQKDQDPDFVRAVAALTRAFDPTRPYIDASGWAHVEGLTDIMDCHDYDQNPETFRARYDGVASGEALPAGKHNLFDIHPTFVSEYGGIRWAPDREGWGYGNAPENGEEFIARFRGLTDALLDCPIMGGLCYTQLTDVEQEVNGLYTYDRKPKFPPEIFREILSRPAAIEKE